MRVRYSLATASLKMANIAVEQMTKIQSKSKNSASASQLEGRKLTRLWNMIPNPVVAKLMYQKQEDYITTYKQEEDSIAIKRQQLPFWPTTSSTSIILLRPSGTLLQA